MTPLAVYAQVTPPGPSVPKRPIAAVSIGQYAELSLAMEQSWSASFELGFQVQPNNENSGGTLTALWYHPESDRRWRSDLVSAIRSIQQLRRQLDCFNLWLQRHLQNPPSRLKLFALGQKERAGQLCVRAKWTTPWFFKFILKEGKQDGEQEWSNAIRCYFGLYI